jgi:gliding motility-associated-like protein
MLKKFLRPLLFLSLVFLNTSFSFTQTKLFSDVPVSDAGINNIGSANTSRNVAVDFKGNIFVVYANDSEVRISKSTNGGESFLPSLLIANATSVEPEININEAGVIFIAWSLSNNLLFTSSTNEGISFSTPRVIGNNVFGDAHISSFKENVYLIDQIGEKLFSNTTNGIGNFNELPTGVSMVYADVLVDQNGVVYTPMDNPGLLLFQSIDDGQTLTETNLNISAEVFYSSYALSDGPCGTFIFVGGAQIPPSETLGYKIDVKTGITTEITLGENNITSEARTLYADSQGTLVDGYRADNGDLMISVSSDQGNNFNTPIVVANGNSHNISRDPKTSNICVVYEKDGEIFLSVYSNILKNIEIQNPPGFLSFCPSDSFELTFTLSGVFTPNTLFSAVLSDEFGDFSNSTTIGTITTNNSGLISCTLPNTLKASDLYRLQVESLDNCIQSNVVNITVGEATITGLSRACVGDIIQLTGSGTPNTTSPWTSSDEDIATIDNNGLVTTIKSGSIVINYFTDNNCTASFQLDIFDLPIINENVSLQQCDDDTDGFSNFNLTEVNSKIINDNSFTFSYHETRSEAENNIASIINFTSYRNEVNTSDIIWARAENSDGCSKISEVNLLVSTTQIPTSLLTYFYECDDGTNLSDGISTFNFSSVTNQITNSFPASQQLTIKYYRNEDDALSELNEITDITNYQNIGYPNQQVIFVRVDSKTDNSCLGLGPHVSLNVEKTPVANPVTVDPECDNDRDGFYSFDTTTIQQTIIGSQTDVSVSYFDESGTQLSSPLPNPFNTQSQTITVLITNTTSLDSDGQCSDESTIDFIVNAVPIAFPVPLQENCDDDTDGMVNFDTSAIENTVLGTQTDLIIKYFDENNNALPSPLPNPFFTNSQTILVRLENPKYDVCFEDTTIDFIVREKPTFDLIQEDIICMTDNPELNLTVENSNNGDTFTWRDAENNTIGNSSTVNVIKGGVYKVYSTSIYGCVSIEKEISITESSRSTININDIEVVDDSENNNIQINTTNIGIGDYEFRLLDEDSNVIINYQDEPFFDNLDGGVYIIEVNDKNGCGAIPFEVSVLEFPEFFTPNNDGRNDFWQIKGLSKNFYSNGIVNVFNRFGNPVGSFSIFDVGWNGNFNTKKLPSSSYWFSAVLTDLKGVTRLRKGHFSLLNK